MFLYDEKIEGTFMKEGFGADGQREAVLVVKIKDKPEKLKMEHPKEYRMLSDKLGYLDNLAKNGFLEFNRIEVTSTDTVH